MKRDQKSNRDVTKFDWKDLKGETWKGKGQRKHMQKIRERMGTVFAGGPQEGRTLGGGGPRLVLCLETLDWTAVRLGCPLASSHKFSEPVRFWATIGVSVASHRCSDYKAPVQFWATKGVMTVAGHRFSRIQAPEWFWATIDLTVASHRFIYIHRKYVI